MGLGDFDTKYGHAWDDKVAYRFALPVLEQEYHLAIPRWDPKSYYFADLFWDTAKTYPLLPDELPHYDEVLREDVFGRLVQDPAWYLGILLHRTWRVFSQTTPVQVRIGGWHVTVPFHGLVFLPLVAVLVATRRWMPLRLALFTLPLCLPAILIYSGSGTCFYSCYHLVTAAILVAGFRPRWSP